LVGWPMSVMSRTMIPDTLRRLTSTSLLPAEGAAVQEADTGGTAPATGAGLGNGAPDEVGEEAADAVAWGEGVRVVCAVELLPQPARTTKATSASPGWSLVTRPRILTRRGPSGASARLWRCAWYWRHAWTRLR